MNGHDSFDILGRWVLPANIIHIYINIIYTPNLGLGIPYPGREREQGRFRREQRESNAGAGQSTEGAWEKRHSRWEPDLAASYPAIAAHVYRSRTAFVKHCRRLAQPPAA